MHFPSPRSDHIVVLDSSITFNLFGWRCYLCNTLRTADSPYIISPKTTTDQRETSNVVVVVSAVSTLILFLRVAFFSTALFLPNAVSTSRKVIKTFNSTRNGLWRNKIYCLQCWIVCLPNWNWGECILCFWSGWRPIYVYCSRAICWHMLIHPTRERVFLVLAKNGNNWQTCKKLFSFD